MPLKTVLAAVALMAVILGMLLPTPHSAPKAEPQSQLHKMDVGPS